MTGLTAQQIHAQAQDLHGNGVHHESLVLVRDSVFTIASGVIAKIWVAAPGENIAHLTRGVVEVNQNLVTALLDSLAPQPTDLIGKECWNLLKAPLQAFADFLKGGKGVIGKPELLLFSLVEAERVLVGLRNCHQILDRAIKRRDMANRSLHQLMHMKIYSGGTSLE
ncbi:hypothetical protein [Cobetia marina]|uniref:hypothetical protein n=1 Tax=Cobetia marina TaxID=28258 RepID=UPI003A8FC8D2